MYPSFRLLAEGPRNKSPRPQCLPQEAQSPHKQSAVSISVPGAAQCIQSQSRKFPQWEFRPTRPVDVVAAEVAPDVAEAAFEVPERAAYGARWSAAAVADPFAR